MPFFADLQSCSGHLQKGDKELSLGWRPVGAILAVSWTQSCFWGRAICCMSPFLTLLDIQSLNFILILSVIFYQNFKLEWYVPLCFGLICWRSGIDCLSFINACFKCFLTKSLIVKRIGYLTPDCLLYIPQLAWSWGVIVVVVYRFLYFLITVLLLFWFLSNCSFPFSFLFQY